MLPPNDDDVETMTYVGFLDGDRERIGPLAYAAVNLRTGEIVCAASWSADGAKALPDLIRRLRREPRPDPDAAARRAMAPVSSGWAAADSAHRRH